MKRMKKMFAVCLAMVMAFTCITVLKTPEVVKAAAINLSDVTGGQVTVLYPGDVIHKEDGDSDFMIQFLQANSVSYLGTNPLSDTPVTDVTISAIGDGGYKWVVYRTESNASGTTIYLASVYKFSVGGVEVNAYNKSDVLGDSGSVKYNWTESKLTLTNATISGSAGIDYNMSRDLTIELVGSNTINAPTTPLSYALESGSGANVTITGSGSLTLKESTYIEAGSLTIDGATVTSEGFVVVEKDMTVKNGASLVINDDSDDYSLEVDGTLSVSSGTLNVTNTLSAGNGVKANKVNITGGTVSATSENYGLAVADTLNISGGTVAFDGDTLAVSGSALNMNITGGQVNLTGGNRVFAVKTLNISGGVVIAEGIVDGMYADNVTISGGTLACDVVLSSATVEGLHANNEIKITGGTVLVKTKDGSALYAKKITLDGATIVTPEGGNVVEVEANSSVYNTIKDADGNYAINVKIVGTTTDPEPKTYDIEGKNQNTQKNNEKALTFRSLADFSLFLNVMVDGKVIDASNYTASEGSTVIVLKEAYLKTLTVGVHTLTINSTDGKAETTFEILAAPAEKPVDTPVAEKPAADTPATDKPAANVPKTGDPLDVRVWMLLAVAGLGLVAVGLKKKILK